MKKTRQLAVIAALGMLAFATSSVQAALITVTIKGTATIQNAATTNNGVVTYTSTKVSVGTQDILETLGTIEGVVVPDGSTLVFDTEEPITNKWTIRNKDGTVIKDVSGRFAFNESSDVVTTGKFTPATGADKTTHTFVATFRFIPGNGNNFDIIGLATSQYSQSAAKNNEYKVSESVKLSGSGQGQVGGADAVVTGTVTGKGSQTVTVPPPPAP